MVLVLLNGLRTKGILQANVSKPGKNCSGKNSCFLIAALLCSVISSNAQLTAPGYYISKTNDSLPVEIKLPRSLFGSVDFSKLLFKVEAISNDGTANKFKPGEIKGFGFEFEDKRYRFVSKPTITENNLRFLKPLIIGENASLYQFESLNQEGKPIGTFYTFEKADGSVAFLNTGIRNLSKFQEVLKEFFKDNIQLQQEIDNRFQTRSAIHVDILTIVSIANK